jgi:hypothetical protein
VGRAGASFFLLAAFVCGSCVGARAGDPDVDATPTVARFCEGLPTVAGLGAVTAPYATFDDGSGDACVFTEGNPMSAACGGLASATIELGCPWTSVLFDMQQRPSFKRELYVHSAYAFLGWQGRAQHGHVVEMVVDNTEGSTITGHYRAEFPATEQFPTVQAQGMFSMCAVTGTSIDPCRQR